jgi:hypothetical protein
LCASADKGGHVRVFQLLSDLKTRLDAGEQICLPEVRLVAVAGDTDQLYARVHAELTAAAGGARLDVR